MHSQGGPWEREEERMKEELLKAEKDFFMDWDTYSDTIVARKYKDDWKVLRDSRDAHYRELFDLKPGMKVLDAGCGHGEYTLFALMDGCIVDAFDFAPQMVKHTKTLLESKKQTPNKLYVGNVLKIDEPDNTYDAAMCLVVLDHIANRDHVLQELLRVIKPGGHLYVDVPNRYAFPWRAGMRLMQMLKLYPAGILHFFSPKDIKSLITRNGFAIEETLGMTFIPPLSGIYTSDIRRFTIFPPSIISALDSLFLTIEKKARRDSALKQFCLHTFLRARKL